MAAVTPNQSYLTKQMQTVLAACFSGFYFDVRRSVHTLPGAWHPGSVSQLVYHPTGWRKDNMRFRLKGDGWGGAEVEFSNVRWDAENSDLFYGPKVLDPAVEISDDGKTKIIQNDTDGEVHVAYEESASLTNSFSTDITKGVTLDVTDESSRDSSSTDTTDASTDASATVGGEYAGVKAEATLAAHFGVSKEKAESRSSSHSATKGSSSELAKQEAEEGSTEESIAIDFTAAPRSYYMITIVKEGENSQQPFDVKGVEDMGTKLHMGQQLGGKFAKHCPHDIVVLQSMDEVAQYFRGYHTDYPEMEGYWETCPVRTRNGINRILSPDMRTIEASGTNYASLESNADYKVELLGNKIPDALAHLPVVSAEDVGE